MWWLFLNLYKMNTKKLSFVLYIVCGVFVIGLAFPVLVSAFIALTTEAKFSECVETFPFWMCSIFGWIGGAVYLLDEA
jgi:succinate dehydrogenase/fumarate reductase cytochrome b subunit